MRGGGRKNHVKKGMAVFWRVGEKISSILLSCNGKGRSERDEAALEKGGLGVT